MLKPSITVLCLLPLFAFAGTNQSDSSLYYFQKGLEEKDKGRKLESVRQFEAAVKFDSTHKEAYKEIAAGYMDMNRMLPAGEAYKKLVELGEETVEVLEPLVKVSYQLRKWDDLATYSNRLKEVHPNAKVHFYLGKMYYDKGDFGRSIPYMEKAIQEDHESAEASYLLGSSYVQMMNYKKAIPYYVAATTAKPNGVWMYELALVYHSIYDEKNSLKYMLMAGDNGYPKNVFYLENLGMTYIATGDTSSGFSILREILEMRPSDLNILNAMAETYYEQKDFPKAIEYWDKVMFHDDNNPKALYMIGLSYQRMGQKDKGMKLCDQAIALDPSLNNLKQKKSMF